MEQTLQFRQMNRAILSWYRFEPGRSALCVEDNDALSSMLLEQGLSCDSIHVGEIDTFCATSTSVVPSSLEDGCGEPLVDDGKSLVVDNGIIDARKYDYILAIDGVIERIAGCVDLLAKLWSLLSDDGILFIGAENRYGLKYFCGDRDPYLPDVCLPIEGYTSCLSHELGARLMGRGDLEQMMQAAGIANYAFYSVLPNVQTAQLIYRDGVLPNESLGNRYLPKYNFPDTVFMHESKLYDGLVANGLFHAMANSFLIECRKGDKACGLGINFVTLTAERDADEAYATIITDDEHVIKHPLDKSGAVHLAELIDNHIYLNAHGIKTVANHLDGNDYVMPYVHGESAYSFLRRLIIEDPARAEAELDRIYDMILSSSEHVDENELGVILKKGFLDLVPWNCFVIDGEYVFYDQEYVIENCPARVIMYRWIEDVYAGDRDMNYRRPIEYFWDRYGMSDHLGDYRKIQLDFCVELRNENELRSFLDHHSGNPDMINRNRIARNTPAPFMRLFEDPFVFDDPRRNIYLFGIDPVLDKFLALYGDEYNFAGILTNDQSLWGTEYKGLPVYEPTHFFPEDRNFLTVIICMFDYAPIYKQMVAYSCTDIRAYDPNMNYMLRRRQLGSSRAYIEAMERGRNQLLAQMKALGMEADGVPMPVTKPYHIGYFVYRGESDEVLRARLEMTKAQCNYLVLGVAPGATLPTWVESGSAGAMSLTLCKPDEVFHIPSGYEIQTEALQKLGFDVIWGEKLEPWVADFFRATGITMLEWDEVADVN